MTSMTINGCSTTTALGSEQYESFTCRIGHRLKKRVQYDYRDYDGELFSCVAPTLAACRAYRTAWLLKKSK